MPPKSAPEASSGCQGCTDSEIKLMLAVLKHMARPTTWDLDKVAEEVGATNANSARERIRMAAKKHDWFTIAGDENATPRPKKAATPRKKKITEAEDGGEQEGTPIKKRPRNNKAKVAAKEEEAPKDEGKDGDSKEPVAVAAEEQDDDQI